MASIFSSADWEVRFERSSGGRLLSLSFFLAISNALVQAMEERDGGSMTSGPVVWGGTTGDQNLQLKLSKKWLLRPIVGGGSAACWDLCPPPGRRSDRTVHRQGLQKDPRQDSVLAEMISWGAAERYCTQYYGCGLKVFVRRSRCVSKIMNGGP